MTAAPDAAQVAEEGAALAARQRRVVRTLAASQVFSGLGNGSALAVGSVLAVELTGNAALGGTTTMMISAAGALSALPLARLALARGRRTALTVAYSVAAVGAACMLAAPGIGGFGLLLAGSFGVGLGAAGNLQARFAATDLATPSRRGRDLGLVVWSITIGAVAGPNLIGPGAVLARAVGLADTAGVFLFSVAGMLAAVVILQAGLRPDPLALRREAGLGGVASPQPPRLRAGVGAVVGDPRIRVGVAAVVVGHAVMVGVMAMTPVHLSRTHGAGAGGADTLVVIGVVISLHIAGMYALSPVWGWAADRWGRLAVTAAGFAGLRSRRPWCSSASAGARSPWPARRGCPRWPRGRGACWCRGSRTPAWARRRPFRRACPGWCWPGGASRGSPWRPAFSAPRSWSGSCGPARVMKKMMKHLLSVIL